MVKKNGVKYILKQAGKRKNDPDIVIDRGNDIERLRTMMSELQQDYDPIQEDGCKHSYFIDYTDLGRIEFGNQPQPVCNKHHRQCCLVNNVVFTESKDKRARENRMKRYAK